MKTVHSNQSSWSSKVRKNTTRVNYWTFAWVFSIGLLAIGPQVIWNFNPAATIFAGLVNVLIGIGMIIANIRYVKGQDEMQQKIFLEAAALTLGVTVVCGGSYQTWADITPITFEPQIWHLMCLMGCTFLVGMFAIARKYK